MKASVEQLQTKYAFTERHACRLLLVSVSSFRYKPQQNDDSLRDRLVALARLSSSACVVRARGRTDQPQAGVSDLLRSKVGAAPKEA